MTISLKNRLALTYALFISLALGVLTLAINIFTGHIFSSLIKENISARSREIVQDIGSFYNPLARRFDAQSIEAIGMNFVHEGYIVTVQDAAGLPVWDARSCDMQQCVDVINSIAGRMETYFGLGGALQKEQYPLEISGRSAGTVTIETYGPFFYSETETQLLRSINRFLLISGVLITLLSIGISAALSGAIARPIKKAEAAARHITAVHSAVTSRNQPAVRIPEHYKTRELAELSRSLNKLAAALEEAERRQKQLSADIAHELRTPLACLQGDMEAMIDGVYAPDQAHLKSCHGEILRLAGLVQDLNTLTGLEWETLSLNKTSFDLAALLEITAEQFRTAAQEKGLAITLQLRESPVTADYDRLKQVFINLLSNAVTHTVRGGITISIREAGEASPALQPSGLPLPPLRGDRPPQRPPARWEITIADTGAGIPARDLPRIFERFYRSDKSRSRSTGGAGIGLTIAAAIVHAHGGTISAESSTEESGASSGTRFRVLL